MEFSADKILIKDFFSNNRKYIIPRYQREYSWENKQLEDFYKDIVSNTKFDNGGTEHIDYFFGTIMLVGDMVQHKEPLQLVDGQQRITTFTIFLSVLSKISRELDERISKNIWKYVIGSDDDGEAYRVLENFTASPYFEERIQSLETSDVVKDAILQGTEQYRIDYAFKYLENKLKEDIIRISAETGLEKISVLKGIRDQLLNSQLIYICSQTEEDVNRIFENINSKGKKLYTLDLIKNEIFSVENQDVPMDKAKELWTQIKSNLVSNSQSIPVDTFYRHFWISNYGQSKLDDLYKKFLDTISKEDYYNFLKNLRDSSRVYMCIIQFDKAIFDGHKISISDLSHLEKCLNNINTIFSITQSRIFILALIEQYLNGHLKFSKLLEIVDFIEEFHFAYNAICKLPNNKLENKYGKFARDLRNAVDKSNSNKVLSDFMKEFKELLPDENMFKEELVKLTFKKHGNTNQQIQKNLIAKYCIKKYESVLMGNGSIDLIDGSIEHIISESTANELVSSIGNLVLLEDKLNNSAGSLDYKDKLKIYKNSKFKSIEQLILKFPTEFKNQDINDRGYEIAEILYQSLYKDQLRA